MKFFKDFSSNNSFVSFSSLPPLAELVSGPSLAFVPNSITASPTKERGPERSANDRLGGLCNFQNEITEFLGQERSRARSRSFISSLALPSFSPRYLWYTPLTRLASTTGEKRNSDTRNAFVERVFSISLNECVASLFLLPLPLPSPPFPPLRSPATIYPAERNFPPFFSSRI